MGYGSYEWFTGYFTSLGRRGRIIEEYKGQWTVEIYDENGSVYDETSIPIDPYDFNEEEPEGTGGGLLRAGDDAEISGTAGAGNRATEVVTKPPPMP